MKYKLSLTSWSFNPDCKFPYNCPLRPFVAWVVDIYMHHLHTAFFVHFQLICAGFTKNISGKVTFYLTEHSRKGELWEDEEDDIIYPSFSMFAKYSEKLTFLTPWYARSENIANVLNEWSLMWITVFFWDFKIFLLISAKMLHQK